MNITSQALGLNILAIECDRDHIHLMISYPPSIALCEAVRRLKGASSRLIRMERFPEVIKKLWGAAFWSPSYFVVSCGGAPLEVVKTYVENQQLSGRSRNIDMHQSSKMIGRTTLHPTTEVGGFRVRI